MFGSSRLGLGLFVLLSVLGPIGCNQTDEEGNSTGDTEPEVAEKDTYVVPNWVSDTPADWPQLVLTNAAKFGGSTPLEGASGFLVSNSKSKVFYATALHLLGTNGGVRPQVEEAKLDAVLENWSVYPRTRPKEQLQLAGLAGTPNSDPESDWVLLRISETDQFPPSVPLQLRKAPVVVGEMVFLIGVPYSDEESAQNVYVGKVTERKFGDRFRFDIDPPVELPGFSGAPILDVKGRVVGVMTVWFDPKREGKLYLEAGGQDAAAVFERVEAAQN